MSLHCDHCHKDVEIDGLEVKHVGMECPDCFHNMLSWWGYTEGLLFTIAAWTMYGLAKVLPARMFVEKRVTFRTTSER